MTWILIERDLSKKLICSLVYFFLVKAVIKIIRIKNIVKINKIKRTREMRHVRGIKKSQ